MDIKSVVSGFQFIGSSVKKVQITNDFITLPPIENIKKRIDVDYVIEHLGRDEKDNTIVSTIILSVHVIFRYEKKKLDIKFDIEGGFLAPYNMDDAHFERMLSTNGCATLYSIARAIIVSMSSQLLVSGCVYLPMINIFHLNEEKQRKVNSN